MRTIPLPLLAAIVLLAASCSRYQVCTISSYDATPKSNDSSFVLENDSVKINYSFAGQSAPVVITIANKSDHPLYVDWQRSAVVYNDSAISYAPDKVSFGGSISSSTYNFDRSFGNSYGSMSGDMQVPKTVTFIPPHSYIRQTTLELAQKLFTNLPDSLFHTVYSTNIADNGEHLKAKKAEFDAQHSPLVFTSYLNIYSNQAMAGTDAAAGMYRQRFYISSIIKTGANPQNYSFRTATAAAGDQFYTKERTGYGKTMTIVGLGGVVVGAAALSAATQTNSSTAN